MKDTFEHSPECQARIDKNDELIDAWHDKWPDHCDTCNGEGGVSYPGSYWEPPDFDPCPECQEGEEIRCPRCGVKGETWDEKKEESINCTKCGWEWKNPDICPPPYECWGECRPCEGCGEADDGNCQCAYLAQELANDVD